MTETGATVTYKGQNYYNVSITTTTYYINSWVYESKSYSDGTLQNAMGYATKLMFSGHEDGRIRPVYTYNTLTSFAGDYFVKDHLGNIRMVLTDEQQVNYYPATTLEGTYSYGAPEANSMVNQEKQYYRIDPGYIVNKPWYNSYLDYPNHNDVPPANPNPNYPAGVSQGQFATSQKVYSLNGSTNRTGLEMVIKVMAGDKVDIFGRSYHTNYSSVSNSNSTPLSILQIMSGLISSPSNAISGKGVSASQLESWNSGLVPSSFIRGQNYESGTTIPKAYINYIFLDDQFRYVGGGASRVGNYGEVKQHWSELSNLAAQKNGYLLVYVSNESNFTVYFDNLQVVHKPGLIVEETHYYSFGLVMNGISSKGLNGTADNKLKFNGKEEQRKEFYDGAGLDWLDFGARMYDAQIGRWNVLDLLAHKFAWQSPYCAMDNNPVFKNDPTGMASEPPGDFYDKKGNYLGTDAVNDKKVYHADAVTKNKDGIVTNATNAKEWNYSVSDTKFQEYLPTLLGHEGGFVNNPKDPGGSTNKGVTLNSFEKYALDLLNVQPTLDNLKRLTDNQAAAIYEVGYWNPSGAGNISDKQTGWLHFDTYVNGGASSVLENTIKAYGENGRGVNILNFIIKSNSGENVFNTYKQERLNRYDRIIQSNPKLGAFKNGWINRVNRFQYQKN